MGQPGIALNFHLSREPAVKNSTPVTLISSGRVLLGLMFVVSGLAKIASTHVQTTGYVVSDGFPLDTLPALGLGMFEVLCGACFAVGYRLRLVALVAAVFVLGASFVFHAFWAVGPQDQFAQQLLFMKNLSMIGGLLLIAGAGSASKSD
jgi:putative oxidoreductase